MSQLKNEIAPAIGPAIISALMVCVVRFFTIPWTIWKGAALRLADMRRSSDEDKTVSSRSEFPVFDWFRAAWDGLIFLSWFLGGLISLLGFVSVAFASYGGGFGQGLAFLFGGVIYTYFSVIGVSLMKESLVLILSIALNVERISKSKQAEVAQND